MTPRRVALAATVLTGLVLLGPSLLGFRIFHATDLLERHAPWTLAPPDTSVSNPLVSDTVDGAAPSWIHFRERVHDGDVVPQWDGHVFGGRPFAALPTEGFYSPLNALRYIVPIDYSFGVTKLVELAAAVGLTFLFLRRLRLGVYASTIGGLVFAFSGFQVVWTNWPQAHVGALIPGVFWGVEVILQQPRPRSMLPLAVVTTVMWLEGFPAVTVYALVFGAVYGAVRLIDVTPVRAQARRLALASGGLALGLGIAAFQMVPFLRWIPTVDSVARQQNPAWTLARRTLATLAVPDAFGSPTGGGYYGPSDYYIYGPVNYVENQAFIGIAALVLIGFGIVYGARLLSRRTHWFFLGGVLACLALIYWGGPPLRLLQEVPLIGTNHIGRLRAVLLFLLAVLAAVGTEALLRRFFGEEHGRRRLVVPACLGGIALIVVAGLRQAGEMAAEAGQSDHLSGEILYAIVIAAIVIAVVAVAHTRVSMLALWVLPIVIALEAMRFAGAWWPQIPPDHFYPVTDTHAFLERELGADRVAPVGQTLLPNATLAYGIRSVIGHSFVPTPWLEALLTIEPGTLRLSPTYPTLSATESVAASPVLDRMAARFLVTDPGAPVLGTRSERAEPAGTITIQPGEWVPVDWLPGQRAVVIALPSAHHPGDVADELRLEAVTESEQVVVVGSRRIPRFLPPSEIELAAALNGATDWSTMRLTNAGDTPIVVTTDEAGSVVMQSVLAAPDTLEVAFSGDAVVYRRLNSLPRIRWASGSVTIEDPVRRLEALADGVDPAAVLLSEPGLRGGGEATVDSIVDDGGDRLVIEVAADGPGYLVIADTIVDWWSFTVDGKPIDAVEADHFGVAIRVEEGNHTIQGRVNPPGVGLGVLLSLISLAAIAGVVFVDRAQEREAVDSME